MCKHPYVNVWFGVFRCSCINFELHLLNLSHLSYESSLFGLLELESCVAVAIFVIVSIMPKDRRDRSVSSDRCKASPYPCSSSHSKRSSPKIPLETEDDVKEWEDARCPVCMEHPHNAVLLICTSHGKGCRPYMCDTSYRHSNCLDQFRKSSAETPTRTLQSEETRIATSDTHAIASSELSVAVEESLEGPLSTGTVSCEKKLQPILVCPLCRGNVKDWIVMDPARRFMNAKSRSCACETCEFSGTYSDLRKHARLEHPLVRPTQTDPERQRNWRTLERQRDIGDLISTLNSSFGEDGGDDSNLPIDDGGWLTVFFLIRVFRPGSGSSPRSNSWSGVSRTRGQPFRRRAARLWGETHDGEAGSSSRDEDNDSSDGGSGGPWRRSERIRNRNRNRTTPDQL